MRNVTETNFLAGPRVMIRPGPLRPYVKFLVGAGKINFPFHYAQGTYLAYAPGAGLDYLLNDRFTIRVVRSRISILARFLSVWRVASVRCERGH